jgi:hypothetical protein
MLIFVHVEADAKLKQDSAVQREKNMQLYKSVEGNIGLGLT